MPSKKHILVVEDIVPDAIHLVRELEDRGMLAYTVDTLEEALLYSRAHHLDCILLDLNLKDSDAEETIAATPKFGDVPIIVTTADEDRTIIDLCTAAGVGLEFKNPLNISTLVSTMLKRMNRHQPSRETANALVEEHHRTAAAAKEATPWVLRWVPLAAFAVALMVASLTGGAFLYRSIGEKAAQTTENTAHFNAVDAALGVNASQISVLQRGQTDLTSMAQTSKEDRAILHRDVTALTATSEQRAREMKEDIVARLNRIEDKIDRQK